MNFSNELRVFQRQQRLYEEVVGAIIRNWPRGGVYLDCGAHLGVHTRPMLERDDVRRTYAFEAIPELCDRLFKLWATNDRFRLIRGAVGNACREVEFSVAVDAPGYSGLKERAITAVKQWRTLKLPLRRLDDLVAAEDAPDVALIKLDLEGGEFDALRGGHKLLVAGRPLLVLENGLRTSAAHYGYQWSDFHGFLEEVGYELHDFFGHRVDEQYWNDMLQTYMFVGVPREASAQGWRDSTLTQYVRTAAGSQ